VQRAVRNTLPLFVASFERPLCRGGRSNSHQILFAVDNEFDAPVGIYNECYLDDKSKFNQGGIDPGGFPKKEHVSTLGKKNI
jgi:hypothetical protein